MQTQEIHFSRPLAPVFFAGATHDDIKWTINYLIGLLDKPILKNTASSMSVEEAKSFLSKHKLVSRNIPADFNGMRDEVNEKYL